MPVQEHANLKALLQKWAGEVRGALSPSGIYCFGSLIYREGAQFTSESDIDLLVVFPQIPDAVDRANWLEQLLKYKIPLEGALDELLKRPKRDSVICSVVAVTSLEIGADLHKGSASPFFSETRFLNLETGEIEVGLVNAGTQNIAEQRVGECVKFAQTIRNQYLGVNALGDENLKAFSDPNDAAPKQCMRHAAMVRSLEDAEDSDPGAKYDLDIGANRITVLLDDRRRQVKELLVRYGSRRSSREARTSLTSKDQLLLAELIFDAAVQVEAKAAAKKVTPKKPSTNGAHSTVIFAQRFASAFPGVHGIEWFSDQKNIRMRLAQLLADPLEFEDGTPLWWSRGSSRNFQISSYVEAADNVLLNGAEMNVRRIAAINRGSYNNYVYVEVAPLPPTGLYRHTAEEIAETESGDSPFPYYWEEYAIVDGEHLVSRSVYDDGSAIIDDELQSIAGRSELRARYVTPYNFIIAGGGAPFLDSRYDQNLEDHLNAMLRGEDRLEAIAVEGNQLPTGRF